MKLSYTETMNVPAKTNILIVEDHPLIRDGIIRSIKDQEDLVVCGEAENVKDAINEVDRLDPDLIIADISLKDSNGIDLIGQLKSNKSDIPVLVVSMHDEPIYIEQAFKAGAKGYILKRESSHQIINAIRKIMRGGMYTSESVSDAMFEKMASHEEVDGIDPQAVLSDREFEVFKMIGQGNTRQQIADQLNVSIRTINTHLERIKSKFDMDSGYTLLHFAIKYYLKNQ